LSRREAKLNSNSIGSRQCTILLVVVLVVGLFPWCNERKIQGCFSLSVLPSLDFSLPPRKTADDENHDEEDEEGLAVVATIQVLTEFRLMSQ
jgi:hypothetical protein